MAYIDTQIEELNLTNYGITGNVFVNQLSKKRITLTNLVTNKTPDKYYIQNGSENYGPKTSNIFTINWLNKNIITKTYSGNIVPNLIARIVFTDNNYAYEDFGIYQTFINYQTPQFIPTATTVKRNGLISGKVLLNVTGTYYNGEVGNVNQGGTYKPTIKYKFWKTTETEPSTYNNTISSSNISVSDGVFSITDLEIGATSGTNYFDPNYSYKIKLYVEDTFVAVNSSISDEVEKDLTNGVPVWTEYADRVDFEKITTRKIIADNIDSGTETITNASAGTQVNFNKTFATPPNVVLTPITNVSGAVSIKIIEITTTYFKAYNSTTQSIDACWIAIS